MLLPLRYRRLWLTLSWILVALALFVCLAPGGGSELPQFNDKIMHALGYLGLTVWFTGICPRSRYALAAILLFLMGVGVELAQGAMALGREADVRDVLANSAGIVAGNVLALVLLGGWAVRVESTLIRRADHP